MTYKKPFDGCFAAPLPPHIDLSNHDIYDVKVTIYPAPRELMGILSVMTESTGMSVTDVVPPPPPKHMKCQLAAPQGKTKEDAMVYLEELLNNWAEHSRKPVDEGGGCEGLVVAVCEITSLKLVDMSIFNGAGPLPPHIELN